MCNMGRNPYTYPNYKYGLIPEDNARSQYSEDVHAVRQNPGCDNPWVCIPDAAKSEADGSFPLDFTQLDPSTDPRFKNPHGSLCCKREKK
jgi:hypothetical protein